MFRDLEFVKSYIELRERNRPFIDSLLGIVFAVVGSWLNCLGAWSKDFAYGKLVNVPVLITQATLPGDSWYHIGLLLDGIGVLLICIGAYWVGRATYIGWRAYREKFFVHSLSSQQRHSSKSRSLRLLETVLNEYFVPLGLTGYVTSDFAIYMAWSMNYYENVDRFFGVFTYGTFWNNAQYFIMVPSLILLTGGIFYKGLRKGHTIYHKRHWLLLRSKK